MLNGFATIASPVTTEVLARLPFGCVTIDLQHGLIDYGVALTMLQICQAYGKPTLVRASTNDAGELGRALDAGFEGVICPGINTLRDAERFVASTRYPPAGARSFGAARAAMLQGPTYRTAADNDILRLAMIGTLEALGSVDQISRCDGIDGLYLAVSDLSLSMGLPPTQVLSGDLKDAVARAVEAARFAKKLVGIHCGSPEGAKQALVDGFDIASLMTDLRIYQAALSAACAAALPP